MNRVTLSLLLLLLLTSCNNKKASIELKIKDAPEKEFILTRLNINHIVPVDTLKSDSNGVIKYKMEPKLNSPQFYYVLYNNNLIAPFILAPGESIKIDTDTLGNYVIEGSADAILYGEREKVFAKSMTSFDSLSNLYLNASEEERKTELNRQMGSLFVKYKQGAIKYIFSNNSIAVIPELYRKFREEIPLFGEQTDVLIYKRVYDSLQPIYPNSPYISYLAQEISNRENLMQMESRFSDAQEIGFPDLVMPDVNNQMQRLSDLNGNVIILSFWSAGNAEQKLFNADLKELYDKYSNRGLRLYQVSLDIDKAMWASVIKSQQVPWVSVCDGTGTSSQAVRLYNVTQLPAMYIIDRDGDIRPERNIFNEDELEKLIKKLL